MRGGLVPRIAAAAATLAIGLVFASLVYEATIGADRETSSRAGAILVGAIAVAIVSALPPAFLSIRPGSSLSGIDAALWAYLLAELVIVTFLSRQSTGAWLNYAIPALVFASTLAGRGLSRLANPTVPRWVGIPIGLASLAIMVSCLRDLRYEIALDRGERHLVEQIVAHRDLRRPSYYFTNRPGWNRVNGRIDLVHDDWLYPVFESIGLAEPRSQWLGAALTSRSPVRAVVAMNPRPTLDGTWIDLRRLGYRPDISLGPFYVWIR